MTGEGADRGLRPRTYSWTDQRGLSVTTLPDILVSRLPARAEHLGHICTRLGSSPRDPDHVELRLVQGLRDNRDAPVRQARGLRTTLTELGVPL